MAVTSSQGVITTTGGGNLDIKSLFLTNDAPPVNPPVDANLPWILQNTVTGTIYHWDIANGSWTTFEIYGVTTGAIGFGANYANLNLNRTGTPQLSIPLSLPKVGVNLLAGHTIPDCTHLGPLPISPLGMIGESVLFWDALEGDRLTVPSGGLYMATARVDFTYTVDSPWSNANIWFRLTRKGLTTRELATIAIGAGAHSRNSISLTGHTYFAENDYLQLEVYNWGGSVLTIDAGTIDLSRLV